MAELYGSLIGPPCSPLKSRVCPATCVVSACVFALAFDAKTWQMGTFKVKPASLNDSRIKTSSLHGIRAGPMLLPVGYPFSRPPRVAHLDPAFPPLYEFFTPAYLSMLLDQKCCKICTIEKSLPSHYIPCFTSPSPRGTHGEPDKIPGVNPRPASPSYPHESLAGSARACLLGFS